MSIEQRPDGTLRFNAHVPLWARLFTMALFFVFAICFAYELFFGAGGGGEAEFRGMALGFAIEPWARNALFLAGTIGMTIPGMFILLGILRGGHPHVRLDTKTITFTGIPMAGDRSLRWDELASVRRYRIQGFPAIEARSRTGRKIQLSAHIFREKDEFEVLCREIEIRAARHGVRS